MREAVGLHHGTRETGYNGMDTQSPNIQEVD